MGYQICRSDEEAWDKALSRGQHCLYPFDNELFLDIDKAHSSQLKNLIGQTFGVLMEHVPVLSTFITRSRRGRAHVYVLLGMDLSPFARTAMQACLGSDPMHALIATIGYIDGSPSANVLFETKYEYGRVLNWRMRNEKKHKLTYSRALQASAVKVGERLVA